MQIKFHGKICDGCGRFSKENIIPDDVANQLPSAEWPKKFHVGTLNVQINTDGWPQIDGLNFSQSGVKCLDRNSLFTPDAYFDHSAIPGNTLKPDEKGKYAGDLQFWRAVLNMLDAEHEHNCYMLRRVKSGYQDKIELVSDIHLRNTYDLDNGTDVVLTVLDKHE